MSQFIDTKHANEAASNAFQGYQNDRERIKQIRQMLQNGESVSNEDALWLCQRAELGIMQAESSWYDHG
jgi:uncharacterized coiled-coil DUF342 family protein